VHKLFNFEPNNKPKAGQKITLIIAYICYLGAVFSAGVSYYLGREDTYTPVFASFIAITVFCICVGFLLHILGSGNLPSLKVDDKIE